MRKLLLLLTLMLLPVSGWCATYYADVARPDNTGDGTTWETAKKNIYPAIKLMSGGDTLIVRSGTYTTQYSGGVVGDTTGDTIHHVPSGSAGSPTTIKADVDFGVILSGIGGGTGINATYQETVVNLVNVSYVDIEGFLIKDVADGGQYGLSAVELSGSDHCKIRKIGVKNGAGASSEYGGSIHIGGSYNLVEDCFACGMMRYGIWGSGCTEPNYNIFRRCVVRWDYCLTAQPRAAITWYGENDGTTPSGVMLMQNCIVIDGNNGTGGTFTGGFSSPHETSGIARYGCISLNNAGYGYYSSESSLSRSNTNTHCILWDCTNGMWWNHLGAGTSGAYNCTADLGISGGDGGATYCEATNNVMVDLADITNMNAETGTVDKVTADFSNILHSPVAAGATIDYKYGTTGTLYGEEGYATLSADSLWPWPYEDTIKTLFSETNDPYVNCVPATNTVARGFCTGTSIGGYSQTLTRYIWEYLGNEIPADIYGDGKSYWYGGSFYGGIIK